MPANTLAEFIELAKREPGKLSYGSAGNGSVHHLTMAVFAARTGLDMLHVPYKGGSALVAATLTGEVQAGWSGIPNVLSHIRAGKLRVYAISTAQRSAHAARGADGCTSSASRASISRPSSACRRRPACRARSVKRLQGAVAKALRERDVAERMANLAMELRENGTEHYARFVQGGPRALRAAVKTAGVKHE